MSATCEQVQEKMAAFVDREIGGAECDRIAVHLEQCPRCTRAVEGQRQVKNILHAQTRSLSAPFALRSRIRRDLAGGSSFGAAVKKIFAFHPLPAGAALAGVAVVFMALTIVGQRWATELADPIAYDADTLIVGKIICADCALMQKTKTGVPHTATHHLVIQAQDGKLWTIVLSPMGQELLQKTEVASQRVQAKGFAFAAAGYVQVTDYKIMQN